MLSRLLSAFAIIWGLNAEAPAQTPITLGAGEGADTEMAPRSGAALLERPARLTVKDAALETALDLLHKQSGVPMVFSRSMIPADRNQVDCRCEGATVGEALEQILAGTCLKYSEVHGQVVVHPDADGERPGPDAPSVTVRRSTPRVSLAKTTRSVAIRSIRPDEVSGRVVVAGSRTPLPGVAVTVVGTGKGVVTDEQGRFSITGLAAGEVRLRVTMIGYRTQQLTVQAGTIGIMVALEETPIELEEIVATGTITPSRRREVATPVAVMTVAEIERRQVQRVDQLFRGSIPGLVAYDPGSRDGVQRVYIRGATEMQGSSIFKVYIDGVESAEPLNTLSTLDPNIIERIEVIRGPQAAMLYGSNAMAGVIQIVTKGGRHEMERPQVTVETSGGVISSDYAKDDVHPWFHEHSASVVGGTSGFNYRFGARYGGDSDLLPGQRKTFNSISGRIMTTQGRLRMSISANHANRGSRQPMGDEVRIKRYPDRYQFADIDQLSDRQQQSGAFQLNYSATSRWQHSLNLGADRWQSFTRDARPGPDSLMEIMDSNMSKTSLDYRTTYDLSGKGAFSATVAAGFNAASHQSVNSSTGSARRTTTPLEAKPDGNISRDAWSSNGLFAQARLGYRDALYLTAGARSDEHSYFGDDFGRAWAPSVGTAYTMTVAGVQTKWRLEWGRGIRAPYPWAKITQNYGTLIFLGNPEIGPERQSGWDGGVDLYFGDRFKVEVTRYEQMVDNSIDMVNLEPINGVRVTQYQNVGKISNEGWELQTNLDFAPFKLIGTFSTMESRIKALSPNYLGMYKVGDKMQQVPDVTANMTLTYNFLNGSASIDVTHIGERINFDGLAYFDDMYGGGQMKNYFDYFVPHDPITKLDVRLEQTFQRRFTVFFWTRNLLDNQQGELASSYASLGRTLGLGLRVRN